MQASEGMGESGETYLVGTDYLMRSDSRFSEESTILKTKVDTETQQSKLFSAFERLGAEHSSTKGSGLGLVIAKGLIESMAGSIGVESEPDQGSTFWIELPNAL